MYLSDEPIGEISEDRLDRNEFVNSLAKAIANWPNLKRSLVIGVYGLWGSGKSSVLNLLKRKLEKTSGQESIELSKRSHTRIKVIQFDPWYFNSAEGLLHSFFGLLNKTVGPLLKESGIDLQDAFGQYTRKLSFSFIPELSIGPLKVKFPLKRNGEYQSLNELKRELANQMEDLGYRIVILIDNLDRLDVEELLLIFKLVRLSADFPNFVFVLAFDRKQVINSLREAQIDKEYLSKIIQIDLDLPTIEQLYVDKIFNEGLDELQKGNKLDFGQEFSNRFGEIYFSAIASQIIKDLRTVKRYLNSISLSLPLVLGEVDYADFFALEVLRVFSPSIFAEIPKYKSEFTALDSFMSSTTDYRRQRRLQVYAEIMDWINGRDSQSAAVSAKSIEKLLAFLFPIFGAYLANPENPTYLAHDNFAENYAREKRIAHQDYFDRYFKLGIPAGDIPNAAVENIIVQLNDVKNKNSFSDLNEEFNIYYENSQIITLIQRLSIHSDKIQNVGKEKLILLFANLFVDKDWISSGDFFSPPRAAIIFWTDIFTEKDERTLNFMTDFVDQGDSFPFVTATIDRLIGKNKLIDKHQSAIIERVKTRLFKDIVKPEINYVEKYPNSFSWIMNAWHSEKMINEPQKSDEYLYQMLDSLLNL